MPRNRIQFQPGLSLPDFLQQYGTVEQCHTVLFKLRWPEGFSCPECGHRGAVLSVQPLSSSSLTDGQDHF